MANNLRVFPSAGAATTMTVNGRVYSCAIGAAPILVPDFDALVLLANGWLATGGDGAGTTAQRPAANSALGIPAPRVGFVFFDTTLGAAVSWNGKAWIHHVTGAAA
jgi:hypothetical protein